MLSFLPGPLLGVISILLFFINMALMPNLIIISAVLHAICPIPSWRKAIHDFYEEKLPLYWVYGNDIVIWLTTRTEIDIQGTGDLSPKGWYFLMANHQSWFDILLVESAFRGRVPFMKFFMKRELLWQLPFVGLAAWCCGFPMVRRYTKSYLKKNPHKKGKDLEITKKACERFKHKPVTVINFVEGTRNTPEKHARQKSPYKHLLKPKAGGMAFTLSAMQEGIREMINVTIVYPDKDFNFWNFVCGRVKKVIIRYEVTPVPDELRGDYYNDVNFRRSFQAWLNNAWEKKDKQIEQILKQQ